MRIKFINLNLLKMTFSQKTKKIKKFKKLVRALVLKIEEPCIKKNKYYLVRPQLHFRIWCQKLITFRNHKRQIKDLILELIKILIFTHKTKISCEQIQISSNKVKNWNLEIRLGLTNHHWQKVSNNQNVICEINILNRRPRRIFNINRKSYWNIKNYIILM